MSFCMKIFPSNLLRIFYLRLVYFSQCLIFFLYRFPSSSLCAVLGAVSSNRIWVLSIKSFDMYFSLETLMSLLRIG